MKIFKNNSCYVEVQDLLRFPLPEFIKLPIDLKLGEFVKFENKDAIEYFKSREDIVDYNSICDLSITVLDKKMKKIKEKFNKESLKWLETSYEDEIKLEKNQEYQNTFMVIKAIYQSLRRYINNKKAIDFSFRFIELNHECRKYPRIQLGQLKQQIFSAETFVDNFAEDGFVENYCLDNEQKQEVQNLRKTKQLTMREQLDDFLMNAK